MFLVGDFLDKVSEECIILALFKILTPLCHG